MKRYLITICIIVIFLNSCSTPETIQIYQENEYINTNLQYSSYENKDETIKIVFNLNAFDNNSDFYDLLEIDTINFRYDDLDYEYGKDTASRELVLESNYYIYINNEIVNEIENVELVYGETYVISYEFFFDDLDGDITFQYAYLYSDGYHFGVSG